MSQVKKKGSLYELQSSISDTVSKAFTFVRESSFPSSRSNSPSGSRSLRIRCDELCGRASEDLSREPPSNPTVVTAQPEPEEPPALATRRCAADGSLTTTTTPTQTAFQQSDGSTPTLALTSGAPAATFDQDQIQRAAGLWATDVPLTDAMSRSELALVPSGSRSRGGGELERTCRGSSPANDSNAPVSRFSIDESSEEEEGPGLEDVESINFESDEDDHGGENDEEVEEYPTVLGTATIRVPGDPWEKRHQLTCIVKSSSTMNLGEAAETTAEAETSNSNHGNNKDEKRAHRQRVALSAFGASSSDSGQAVEDEQSIAEDSESDESEPVVSEVQLDDSSKTVGLAL